MLEKIISLKFSALFQTYKSHQFKSASGIIFLFVSLDIMHIILPQGLDLTMSCCLIFLDIALDPAILGIDNLQRFACLYIHHQVNSELKELNKIIRDREEDNGYDIFPSQCFLNIIFKYAVLIDFLILTLLSVCVSLNSYCYHTVMSKQFREHMALIQTI